MDPVVSLGPRRTPSDWCLVVCLEADFEMDAESKSRGVTRREFVAVGTLGTAALAAGCGPKAGAVWEFFSETQARTLKAICDQIIPRDDFPSASEAGVLNYIDRQLVRHYRLHQDAYRDGLEQAESASRKRFGKGMSELGSADQLAVVTDLERDRRAFFELVRNHTLEGYYGSPRHGGNRDEVSWRMLGLDDPPLLGRAQYDLTRNDSGEDSKEPQK
jgi:gluconate 2-dehydrogenase gamma chain